MLNTSKFYLDSSVTNCSQPPINENSLKFMGQILLGCNEVVKVIRIETNKPKMCQDGKSFEYFYTHKDKIKSTHMCSNKHQLFKVICEHQHLFKNTNKIPNNKSLQTEFLIFSCCLLFLYFAIVLYWCTWKKKLSVSLLID